MKTKPFLHALFLSAVASALTLTSLNAQNAQTRDALLKADFEPTSADQKWPEGWERKSGSSWGSEEGNRFLRLQSVVPDQMIMIYKEVHIPAGTEALELSWKQRVSEFSRGTESWFDARIMMEFMDADRGKISQKPSAPKRSKNSNGWEEKTVRFNVPEGARILKFMPTLFRVESGIFDLDDIVLRPVAASEAAK